MENIQDLVARVISGDMQAFEAIYQATYRQVYYTCLSFLRNEQNTLDMMQETYITALTHLQQLEEPERITAWLNRIAVNKCKDFLTKKMPVLMDDDSIIDQPVLEENDNFLPESYVLNAEKRKIILTIMQEELTAIQYQTILLYYFDGMSVPEIAACMECPEGTVKYRLSAARGKIKQGVQDYENTNGIKLYSSGSVALLTAIFMAESQSLVIPNVLSNIFAGAAGLAGTVTGVAGAVASTGPASAIGAGAAGKVAGKAGIKGLFQTLKAKIVYEFRFLSANGEWMDDDRETETTWYLDADYEMTICMNNPDRLIGSTGRDSLTWAKTELYVWMINDEGVAEQLDKNAFSNDPYFYVENKTDHDLKIEVEGTATLDGKTAKLDQVYDYTESYGEYINDNVYGTAHGNSIKEILDPTMKQYDAQIVMRNIND